MPNRLQIWGWGVSLQNTFWMFWKINITHSSYTFIYECLWCFRNETHTSISTWSLNRVCKYSEKYCFFTAIFYKCKAVATSNPRRNDFLMHSCLNTTIICILISFCCEDSVSTTTSLAVEAVFHFSNYHLKLWWCQNFLKVISRFSSSNKSYAQLDGKNPQKRTTEMTHLINHFIQIGSWMKQLINKTNQKWFAFNRTKFERHLLFLQLDIINQTNY